LRELILELAVRGKLVAQDPADEPASVLLERIAAEKKRLLKEGKIKKQKALPPIAEEEKPFGLPEAWAWVRLGELGYTQTGGTPSKTKAVSVKQFSTSPNHSGAARRCPCCAGGGVGRTAYRALGIYMRATAGSPLRRISRGMNRLLKRFRHPFIKTFPGIHRSSGNFAVQRRVHPDHKIP
jgi:hypothetical protein